MILRRAWNATCPDGELRDYFANAVEHRITQVDNCPGDATCEVELAEDFVSQCDKVFAAHNPQSYEEAAALALAIDTTGLYDLVGN